MTRKNRPYEFYDTTSSVCTTCLHPVEAKIIFKSDEKSSRVYMDKWCPVHGHERVLMMDDADYYRACREVYVKHPEMPARFATPMQYGCPYDCGLCPDHMQHSCLTIVEITDVCNLDCPVCFADSGLSREQNLPHLPYKHKDLATVKAMLDTVVASEGEPDVVQLSGGEPTLHPDFFAILDYVQTLPIRHVMINTNGIRLAKEADFVARLAEYATRFAGTDKTQGLEIYLQFDSLDDAHIQVLRGAKLAGIHEQALANLEAHNLSTTLVATIKQGLNDHVMGDIIKHGLNYRCVRGVSFQPLSEAGRVDVNGASAKHDIKHNAKHRLTLSQMRRQIAEQSDVFTIDDIVPVPCNPDTLAMGYALKTFADETNAPNTSFDKPIVTPLSRYLTPDDIMAGGSNTILFEQNANVQTNVKDQLIKVLATNHSPESQANCLSELLCCLPKIDAPHLGYDNVFRVMLVQFMDAQNLDIRALKKSCIHFAQPDGTMIPFESFNILYRDDRKQTLAKIRHTLEQSFQARRVDNERVAWR